MHVTVAYAETNAQHLVALDLPETATVQDALILSAGLLPAASQVASRKVGVFGKLASPDTPLRAGDRVEIYRALLADPKEVRKKRASEKPPAKRRLR